jgi:hypothetical protein
MTPATPDDPRPNQPAPQPLPHAVYVPDPLPAPRPERRKADREEIASGIVLGVWRIVLIVGGLAAVFVALGMLSIIIPAVLRGR